MLRLLTTLVAIISIIIGTFTNQFLPTIIDKLIALDNDSAGLQRLRIGHAMAGGGEAGTIAMADAIRTTLLSRIFGVKNTSSRRAWRDFVKVLHDAERQYLSPTWGFALGPEDFAADEIAEGLRYVSHVTKLALDIYLEESPRFVRVVSPTLKILGDNPDAVYHLASLRSHESRLLDDSKEFIVEGCHENEVYFSFAVHVASLTGGAFERVITDINDEDITLDSDGCYKILLSSKNPGENVIKDGMVWLEMPRESTSLISRHYFRSSPPAALHEHVNLSIRPREKEECAPRPVTDATIAHRIDLATDFIKRHTILMPQPDPTTSPPFFSLIPNTIGPPQKWQREADGQGAVDIAYAAGRFRLEDDEALILEGSVPRCRFGNVVLWNRYLQTLDYTAYDDYPVFYTLDVPSEGQESAPFAIVLSGKKQSSSSDKYKWMHTEGRPMGTIFFRFLLPEGDKYEYQRINATVVSVNEVTAYFENKD